MENKKTKNSKKTLVIVLCVVLAVLIIAVAAAAIWYFTEAKEAALTDEEVAMFEELQATLDEDVFIDGITIDGVEVGGMTETEAKFAVQEANKAKLNELEYTFEIDGEEVIIKQSNGFCVSSNLIQVLNKAMNCIDITDTRAALEEYADIKANGREFSTESAIIEDSLMQTIDKLSKQYGAEAADATWKVNYDAPVGEKVEIVEGQSGLKIDAEAMYNAIVDAFGKGESATLEVAMEVTEPEVTKEDLEGKFAFRAAAMTEYKTAGTGYATRVFNIKKATDLVNGKVLAPGEKLSMNDTLGPRTYANGWQEGGALVNGATETQAGGGVCQVATTLYNAVVKSDLEIVYRQNHSERSSYIAGGLDATINTGTIDFVFKNNTNSDILIIGYNVNQECHFEIYGEPWGEEYDNIRLTSKQTGVVLPDSEMQYQVVKGKPASYKEVKVKTKSGSEWVSYKNYYKGDTLVKTEFLAKSKYKAFAGLTLIGEGSPLDPNAKPTPTTPSTSAPTTPEETPTPSTPSSTEPSPEPTPDASATEAQGE